MDKGENSMSASSLYGKDSVTAGEYFCLLKPKNYAAPKIGILYVHGAESNTYGNGAINWQQYKERALLLNQLAGKGYTVLSCDLGGNATWGNDTVVARILAARTYLLTQGVLPNKVVLMGTSMGALASLVAAKQNAGLVSSVVGILPCLDLTDIWANRGFATDINAAYGGTYSEAAYGATHNPITMASAGAGYGTLPIQLWYGTSDTIALPSKVTAFQAAVGSSCQINSMTGGHTEAAMAGVSLTSLVAFIEQNAV